jgi:hypothetical protein
MPHKNNVNARRKMKIKMLIIFIISLLFLTSGRNLVFAMEHTQMNGLFSMDVPGGWHWDENSQEVIITYPDGKTMAIDIELVPIGKISKADIKKMLKEGDDKMIKEGINAHHGTLIDDKEIKLDGVYTRQLDFKTIPPNPIHVTYISFVNKGRLFTITYGSEDDKMHSVMDDAIETFKF